MAKERNPRIFTVLDAAHSIAHHTQTLQDMPSFDAVGGSLHKWLCNPIGVGFLHLKPSAIPLLWPLMGDTGKPGDDIRRFEHQGTRPIHSLMSLSTAIDFHESIGSQAKKARLHYLKLCIMGSRKALGEHYQEAVHGRMFDLTRYAEIDWLCPWENPEQSGAIVTVSVKGLTPQQLAASLKKAGVFTVAIDHPVVKGVRITPHLSNTPADCLALNAALAELGRSASIRRRMFDD